MSVERELEREMFEDYDFLTVHDLRALRAQGRVLGKVVCVRCGEQIKDTACAKLRRTARRGRSMWGLYHPTCEPEHEHEPLEPEWRTA